MASSTSIILDVKEIADKKLDKNKDIIIAFLGPTGSGKSHLIDTLTGQTNQPQQRSGSQLESKTQQVQATRLVRRSTSSVPGSVPSERRIVLVDTPGFDDTHRSDMEILQLIAAWLKKTYEGDIKLKGIVYTHRITDNRMSGSPHRNLRMFKDLCGDDAASRVVFATTMWDRLTSTGEQTAKSREKELMDMFWRPMMNLNSRTARFLNTEVSAWQMIEHLIPQDGQETQIQFEMVDKHRKVKETKAGIALLRGLQEVLKEQQMALGQLEASSARSSNQAAVKAQMEQIQDAIQNTTHDIQQLKIPLARRLLSFFMCGVIH
ncbi:P-loop containing nucleoside triphosphate hydrolase protein [Panaeolus papilionaceus]|nr:P-loop containing nucleoside triphosphate hydrolase protein [Panaeolus papilionaceus]